MSHVKQARRIKSQAIIFFTALLILVFGVYLYNYYQARSQLISVKFVHPDGKQSKEFYLKVFSSDAERQRGLMYVKEMPEQEGALFIFPSMRENSFWMKNTYISLDMLFLDQQHTVLGILENVPVLNTQPRTINQPSQYVIELNAGAAKSSGIVEGSRAVYERALPIGLD